MGVPPTFGRFIPPPVSRAACAECSEEYGPDTIVHSIADKFIERLLFFWSDFVALDVVSPLGCFAKERPRLRKEKTPKRGMESSDSVDKGQ